MFYADLVEAIGSDDGREIACGLDELRQSGKLGRDRDGRYHLVAVEARRHRRSSASSTTIPTPAPEMQPRLINALWAALCCAMLMLAAPAPQTAQAADKVVAGSLGGQAPLWAIYVAVHKGFFAAEGLDLELNFAQSGAAVTQQLTGGSLDVALSVGITDPIHAIDKGAPLAIVRIVGNAAPYVLIGKPELKSIKDLKGKTISVGSAQRHHHGLFRADDGGQRPEEGRLRADLGRRRRRPLCRAQGRRRRRRGGAAAAQLPGRDRRLPHARLRRRLREGPAVHRHGGASALGRRQWLGSKRVLAATDKSVAWLADPARTAPKRSSCWSRWRVRERKTPRLSYDFLKRISYFEPGSKVSRTKLQNLVDVEKKSGNIGQAFIADRLVMPGVTELVD